MAKKSKAAVNPNDFRLAAHRKLLSSSNSDIKVVNNFNGIGIRMPLLMQYLWDVETCPLGLLVQVIGEHATRKTTFLFEIGNWFIQRGGIHFFTLTEGKMSDELQWAVNGWPDEMVDQYGNPIQYPFIVNVKNNMNAWQKDISQQVTKLNDMMDNGFKDQDGNSMPPGLWSPYLFGVDSLVAQLTANQADTIEKQGGADRGYATHVKAVSEWISQVQSAVTNRPYMIAMINHCAVDRSNEYQKNIKEKGGRKLAYESSLIVYMERGGVDRLTNQEAGWAPEMQITYVKMNLNKSSLGNDSRKIVVPIEDKYQLVENSKTRQRTRYLWGTGLVNLLMSRMYSDDTSVPLHKSEKAAGMTKKFREAFMDVSKFEKSGSGFICKKYHDDVLTAEQLGEYLQNDEEFVRVFRAMFAIKHYREWPVDTEYGAFTRQVHEESFRLRTGQE